jgi:hypothetical protein
MNRNRFFGLVAIAALIVAVYLVANAVGPKVEATGTTSNPIGIGELRLFEASQSGVVSGSASSVGMGDLQLYEASGVKNLDRGGFLSPQALSAWAARYAGEAAALGAGDGVSAKALAAWAARYEGEAAASGAGSLSTGALSTSGAWNPDAFYAGGGG